MRCGGVGGGVFVGMRRCLSVVGGVGWVCGWRWDGCLWLGVDVFVGAGGVIYWMGCSSVGVAWVGYLWVKVCVHNLYVVVQCSILLDPLCPRLHLSSTDVSTCRRRGYGTLDCSGWQCVGFWQCGFVWGDRCMGVKEQVAVGKWLWIETAVMCARG